jgi:cell division protein FtsI/penicillin-binding protein 2
LGTISGYLLIIGKLFYWQLLIGPQIVNEITKQNTKESFSIGKRGGIMASGGQIMAENITRYTLWTDPLLTKDISGEQVQSLAKSLSLPVSEVASYLHKKDTRYVVIKKRLSKDEMDNVSFLQIKGLGFDEEQVRLYPEASSSSQITGFLGKDETGKSKGYFGLEGYYDLVLGGKEFLQKFKVDALGRRLETNKAGLALDGATLTTSIDLGLQVKIQAKLTRGVEKYGAVTGNVIIMEPKTGNILAMATWPTYDPNSYWQFDGSLYRNPLVSDAFEPGSVFKVLVMAGALDKGKADSETKCDICEGPYKIDKYQIETWNKVYYPESTMADVIVHSDNVGMVFVAQKLGKDNLYEALNKFGFGKTSGIDLQGEISPKLKSSGEWSDVDLATISFGQGIAVTPIQLIRAVGAIANKGVMATPQVAQQILINNKISPIKREKNRRVISEKASDEITEMMVKAAKNGEAKWTNLPGFRVAGKTGTAQIPIAGHYDAEKTIASFVGFAPAEDPKFVMLVTLREPQSSQWASETAAPLWYDMAKDLFIKFGISPEK